MADFLFQNNVVSHRYPAFRTFLVFTERAPGSEAHQFSKENMEFMVGRDLAPQASFRQLQHVAPESEGARFFPASSSFLTVGSLQFSANSLFACVARG